MISLMRVDDRLLHGQVAFFGQKHYPFKKLLSLMIMWLMMSF